MSDKVKAVLAKIKVTVAELSITQKVAIVTLVAIGFFFLIS